MPEVQGRQSMEADSAPRVFDRDVALQMLGGDTAFFAEIVGLLRNDLPRLLAEVRQAVEKKDARAIKRTAHALKGAVSYAAATATLDAAERLERIGASGELSEAADALNILEHEAGRLALALSALSL